MTSANVVEFRIANATKGVVGEHRQHLLCKPNWQKLLSFQPPEDYLITPHGYDEDEEEWEGEPMNLRDFLVKKGVIN